MQMLSDLQWGHTTIPNIGADQALTPKPHPSQVGNTTCRRHIATYVLGELHSVLEHTAVPSHEV